jgi:iron complex outermembrane receptor protein
MTPRLLTLTCLLLASTAASAQTLETVVVYGTLANSDIGQSAAKVPATLQSFGGDAVNAGHGATILDALGNRAAGVGLSDSQGNSMFEDLRYHGYEASPLQGAGQGVAVYQNGVRLNEAFGDTVNWDAIPQTAIARMDLWSANPVFGLNALGGAINVVMKNGFTFQGGEASVQGGSFGHAQASLQYGLQDGDVSLYGAAEGVHDDGWRLHSGSSLGRIYLDGGWRVGDSEFHLVASGAQSRLGVVGPTPVELIARNSKAVYTWPQTTNNEIGSLALNAKSKLADNWQLEASGYVRALRQRHVDGNDGDFERCSNSSSFANRLCLEDDGFVRPVPFTGAAALAFRNQFAILTTAGASIPFTAGTVYGTIDRTATDSTTDGATLQLTGNAPLFGLGNYFTAGGSLDHSAIGFRSTSTLGRIYPDLSVQADPALAGAGNVIHAAGNVGYAPADLGGTTDYYGLYIVDALDLTPALTLTAGLRFNSADIDTRDRSGTAPELTGSHTYSHANPLAGLTWQAMDGLTVYGNYSEANRAPTPLESDCADPTRPCLLEGALVADPPLAQVVAHNYEAGLRGAIGGLGWNIGFFRSDSDNDIVALASTIQGRGYYTNVPETRREGFDAGAHYNGDGWSTYLNWSYLDATYRFTGTLASPNNPAANAAGNVTVTSGDHIPLNPAHQVRLGGDWQILPDLSVGGEFAFTGSQYFDGDNANQNAKLPAYTVVNIRVAYDLTKDWQLFGLVDNLFNSRDATYGTYFEPGGTAGLVTPALSDPRSLTLQQPLTVQAGVKFRF